MRLTHRVFPGHRAIASMMVLTFVITGPTQGSAITYDSITGEFFETIDDYGLASGSDNISLRFGGTLGEYLRFNQTTGRFVFTDDLDVQGTASGTALTIMGGNSYFLGKLGIGTSATPEGQLEVAGTISGTTLRLTGGLSVSGALALEQNTTLSGSALYGFGLVDCDTSATSKLLWDTSTGRFSCGTDQTGGGSGFSTGNVLTIGDSRYVNTAGDTMTGALTIQNGNTHTPTGTALINVRGVASGVTLYGNAALRSSGALVWEGAASGNTLAVSGNATFAEDLTFGNAINDAITVNAASWTFANATNFAVSNAANALSIDTDTFSVDALNNRIGIRTTAPDNPLEVIGTISGSVVYANNGLRSSGSLVWEGVGSGASLYIGGSLQGVGLSNCDNATTSKLLWNSATGRFSCGTDQSGGAGSPEVGTESFSGGVVRVSDGRYVNTAGDTMTGVLTVQNGNTHTPTGTALINTRGTMSGVTVYANSQLRSSGSLAVEGTTAFRGIQYTWPGSAASASGKVLKVDPANGQLSWSDDSTGGGGGPSTVVSTANVSDSTTGGTNNVTGLSIPVSASTNYIIRCLLTTNAATTTTGVQITVNGPASPSQITWTRQSCSSVTAVVNASINAFGTEDARTASAGTTRCIEPINIHLRNNGTAGNVTFSVDTEVASSAVTVYQGSFCDYQSY